ncbi:MAG TPA: hypothetical protein VJ952_07235 [Opitutales bacterium]|nr:hypothetical protein [Opitutales bacterium]
MLGGGRGEWFDFVLLAIAAGIAFPSALLSKFGIEYWKQTKRMVLTAQVAVFAAYFLFATVIHFALEEPYGRLMVSLFLVIFVKMAYSLVNSMIGYKDDSPY